MQQFIPERLETYLYWISEREMIRYRKENEKKEPPWTEDEILKQFKFCQVFREDDRTTRWFREHIRDPLKDSPDVVMATIIFKFFNLIETGRTLLDHNLHLEWDREKAIREIRKQPKWVTGAYIVKTPNRMDKVTGVAECVSHIWFHRHELIKKLEEITTLEEAWSFLLQYPYIGPFVSYEIVTDLRHTYLLRDATDIKTWANAGPGAMRGLNRLTGRPLEFCRRSHNWNEEMQELYWICTNSSNSTLCVADIFPREFEMREIEGALCEFDKYSRISNKEGRTRSVYNYKERNRPLIEDLERGESRWVNSGNIV
tara:strand:+ start:7806 stop:8747 length:942 start_codon:yes stop_codon:yes gene_type:complete